MKKVTRKRKARRGAEPHVRIRWMARELARIHAELPDHESHLDCNCDLAKAIRLLETPYVACGKCVKRRPPSGYELAPLGQWR